MIGKKDCEYFQIHIVVRSFEANKCSFDNICVDKESLILLSLNYRGITFLI
jgi:hypothetical protein